MDNQSFREWAVAAAQWASDYRATLSDKPVRAQTPPGAIAAQLPGQAPELPEAMSAIFADFERIILPGMTHWQHPRFFAYFPANASPLSVIAEILVSAMAAQCMLWQTSPAATELETVMLQWLRQALGLPEGFSGVIQDSASSATLAAVLVMRERALGFAGNKHGLAAHPNVRIYASDQTHSSIDKAVWIAGIGQDNLVKVPSTGPAHAMDVDALEASISADRSLGLLPAGIVACVGGTSTGAIDNLTGIAVVAKRHGLYVHVDAAWAGAAMICPEFRTLWAGSSRSTAWSSIRTNGSVHNSTARRISCAMPTLWSARWPFSRNFLKPTAAKASSTIVNGRSRSVDAFGLSSSGFCCAAMGSRACAV